MQRSGRTQALRCNSVNPRRGSNAPRNAWRMLSQRRRAETPVDPQDRPHCRRRRSGPDRRRPHRRAFGPRRAASVPRPADVPGVLTGGVGGQPREGLRLETRLGAHVHQRQSHSRRDDERDEKAEKHVSGEAEHHRSLAGWPLCETSRALGTKGPRQGLPSQARTALQAPGLPSDWSPPSSTQRADRGGQSSNATQQGHLALEF